MLRVQQIVERAEQQICPKPAIRHPVSAASLARVLLANFSEDHSGQDERYKIRLFLPE
jgi:hypothetical protein